MEKTNQNSDEIVKQEDKELVSLPPSIADEDKDLLYRELTTILSRRWLKDEIVVFGCSEMDLLLATRFDINTLRELIEEYKSFIKVLGLEVIEYTFKKEKWYCLKSGYYAPSELGKAELVILGTVIALLEENQKKSILTEKIKEKLVLSGKIKEYLLEASLRKLVRLGYLQRTHNKWSYNYRTLVEFGEEERKKIVEEFRLI